MDMYIKQWIQNKTEMTELNSGTLNHYTHVDEG